MIEELDNARVLMLSESGHYGYIKISGSNETGIEVCYLAICKYDKDNGIYLFLCDKNMSVENDLLFDCVDDAVSDAQRRFQSSIVWSYTNTAL